MVPLQYIMFRFWCHLSNSVSKYESFLIYFNTISALRFIFYCLQSLVSNFLKNKLLLNPNFRAPFRARLATVAHTMATPMTPI